MFMLYYAYAFMGNLFESVFARGQRLLSIFKRMKNDKMGDFCMYKKVLSLVLGCAVLFCSCAQPTSPTESVTDEEAVHSWFYVPPMDAEEQQYYDDYIRPLIYNGMLMASWSNEDYTNISAAQGGANEGSPLIMAFEDIVGEDTMQTLWTENSGNLPGKDVEEVLLERFPFSVEQLHEILAACYDEQTNTYAYSGGRGGGPVEGAVISVESSGDYVYLSYEVFTGYSGIDEEPASYLYKRPGILTIKKYGDAYRYWSVEAGEEIEANIL